LCLDILQLPRTANNNRYLLVCVDHFSKYAIVEPLKRKSAEEVATGLLNRVVLIHGAPKKIYSDKGKEFVNSTITQLKRLLHTEQSTTAGYNPRANGEVERVNQEIVRMLRKSCIVPQEWDLRVPYVIFGYNTSVHTSTNESPYYIVHGRDPNFPSAIDPELIPHMYADSHGFKELVAENVNEVAKKVRESLEKARADYKHYYDTANKVFKKKYYVGQRVMATVFDPKVDSSDSRKLNWKFYGPFESWRLKALMRRFDQSISLIPSQSGFLWIGWDPFRRNANSSMKGGGRDVRNDTEG